MKDENKKMWQKAYFEEIMFVMLMTASNEPPYKNMFFFTPGDVHGLIHCFPVNYRSGVPVVSQSMQQSRRPGGWGAGWSGDRVGLNTDPKS